MPAIRWQKAGEADLLALDADRATVRSTIPSAPGSRLDGTLASGRSLRLKVHRCRKIDEGFEIEGRLLDATREARAELATLLPIR